MPHLTTRRALLAAVGVASVSGCLGGGGTDDSGDDSPGGDSVTDPADTATETGSQTTRTKSRTASSGSPPTVDRRLSLPMEPAAIREEAVSGGPPKDGIPSIDDPSFLTASAAGSGLAPGEPVFGLATDGVVRAYPQSILVLHEICNDVVNGTPVSVTYCPLTGTAMGFERGDTTFGVSGRLVNNNLIMYDRGTEAWWPQVLATPIPGPWNDDPPSGTLSEFRLIWTTWERWSNKYPDTEVLSDGTGFAKNYSRDPYGTYNPRRGYYKPEASPMFPALSEDDRLLPKRVVIGARTAEGAVAFEKNLLRDEKVIEGTLAGDPVVAVYDPELDTGYVYRNPDGRTFEYEDGRITDDSGDAYAPSALPTDGVYAFDAMWFAWSGFYPETTLYA